MIRVHLNPEGEAVTGKFKEAINTTPATRFNSWPSSQRDRLAQLLRSTTTALRS
ncbi:hypothetical protein [Nonomuraea fuscirosea]|uniref:hypothetical protein n=1 Tax=Nonomuraea fuscirosea TaxID=1291556 RepID=UPI003401FB8F